MTDIRRPQPAGITYHLDPNHVGLRVGILLAIVIGAWVAAATISPILLSLPGFSQWSPNLLWVVISVAGGITSGWIAEHFLAPRWASGRQLQINDIALTLRESSGEVFTIKWADTPVFRFWYFIIKGQRAWVPQGSYCTAFRAAQGETVISLYTFLQPRQFADLPLQSRFALLQHSDPQDTSPGAPAGVSQQELRLAEAERWNSGAEMTAEEFFALLTWIGERISPESPSQETTPS